MNNIPIGREPVKNKISKKIPWQKWRKWEDSRRRNIDNLSMASSSIEKRRAVQKARQAGLRLRRQAEAL